MLANPNDQGCFNVTFLKTFFDRYKKKMSKTFLIYMILSNVENGLIMFMEFKNTNFHKIPQAKV